MTQADASERARPTGPRSLQERYTAEHGTQLLTGNAALVRLPVDQMRRDRRVGLRTAALVTGYPGSPLGNFDLELGRMRELLAEHDIHHQPAINEDLAATALFGSQLAAVAPDARFEGVVGVWYGKAPGLDRATDAVRHAVFAGTSARSGVVALVGDDPVCKSSTLPSSSERLCAELCMPLFHPGDVQDILDLGAHAVAQSRTSGLWSSMRIVVSVADASGHADVSLDHVRLVVPEFDDGGLRLPTGVMLQPDTLEMEREIHERRLPRAVAYASANGINRIVTDPDDAWLGLVASGHTYRDVVEALRRLGLEVEQLGALGVRLLQVRQPWPIDPHQVRHFGRGLDEIVVVEEKRAFIETQVRDALYGTTNAPRVIGKRDETGAPFLDAWGGLDADALVAPLTARLTRGLGPGRLRPATVATRERIELQVGPARQAWFCAGCPHGTSTQVPDGSLVGMGIGCHGLAARMRPEHVGRALSLGQMGSEGAQWVGAAPFVEADHLFQNIGDGTLFHSGWLALRFAVAAGVHMTYKVLYNDAVSMTGGQQAVANRSVPDMARSMLADGVTRILVTTEDLGRYRGVAMPKGVEVWDRSRIIEAQELLAAEPGVTVLIHDQRCAAEVRRDRNRGRLPKPAERVVVNARVCEHCGDCGVKSSCLAVQTVETPLGPKTAIDQSSCNVDLSCLQGDCPSFMLVREASGRRRRRHASAAARLPTAPDPGNLPEPVRRPVGTDWVARMPGIGGTGVVTASQVLGMAANLDGWHVHGLDQTGLSQKAGPVVSDLLLTRDEGERVGRAGDSGIDLLLAFDAIVGFTPAVLVGLDPVRTAVVASTSLTPTGMMIGHREIAGPDLGALDAAIAPLTDGTARRWIDAAGLSRTLLGDGTAANILLLGVALQLGAIPVSPSAVEDAIALNGVAVEKNLNAFRWGRLLVADPAAVPTAPAADPASIDWLADDLRAYQGERYARRFLATVERARVAEAEAGGDGAFTAAIARHLHQLMAYKDEYEVARLHTTPDARASAEAVAGPGARRVVLLHPPALRALGMKRKLRLDRSAGPVLSVLARAKVLRGTPFDVFGWTRLRRLERNLRDEYVALADRLAEHLDRVGVERATEIASLADQIRGYEHLKVVNAAQYRRELAAALAAAGI
ncbi:MAG: indolepyruvate ferredoxin oxidoreductase family protein [Acidimicrobiia bacterium]